MRDTQFAMLYFLKSVDSIRRDTRSVDAANCFDLAQKGLPASIIALLGSDGSPSSGRLHLGFRCRAPLGISLAIGHNAGGNGIDPNAGPFHNAGGDCSTFDGRDAEPSDDPDDVDYANRGRATLNSGHHCVGQQAGPGSGAACHPIRACRSVATSNSYSSARQSWGRRVILDFQHYKRHVLSG